MQHLGLLYRERLWRSRRKPARLTSRRTRKWKRQGLRRVVAHACSRSAEAEKPADGEKPADEEKQAEPEQPQEQEQDAEAISGQKAGRFEGPMAENVERESVCSVVRSRASL